MKKVKDITLLMIQMKLTRILHHFIRKNSN